MPDQAINQELLRQSPFFASAGEAAMSALLRPSFTQRLPRGAVLFEQNETADFLHLLLAGSIGLHARDETGEQTVVEIFGAGEVFLAPAVILQLPYLASGTALTDVRVLLIPADVFRAAIERDAALSRATMRLLSRHWRLLVEQIVDLKLRPAGRRIARFLARRIPEETGAGSAQLPEPRCAIAARLGMTPETLSRSLSSLEADGVVRLSGKRIDVPDRARLLGR